MKSKLLILSLCFFSSGFAGPAEGGDSCLRQIQAATMRFKAVALISAAKDAGVTVYKLSEITGISLNELKSWQRNPRHAPVRPESINTIIEKEEAIAQAAMASDLNTKPKAGDLENAKFIEDRKKAVALINSAIDAGIDLGILSAITGLNYTTLRYWNWDPEQSNIQSKTVSKILRKEEELLKASESPEDLVPLDPFRMNRKTAVNLVNAARDAGVSEEDLAAITGLNYLTFLYWVGHPDKSKIHRKTVAAILGNEDVIVKATESPEEFKVTSSVNENRSKAVSIINEALNAGIPHSELSILSGITASTLRNWQEDPTQSKIHHKTVENILKNEANIRETISNRQSE